mgnify:CR=1 FL=1
MDASLLRYICTVTNGDKLHFKTRFQFTILMRSGYNQVEPILIYMCIAVIYT